MIQRRRDQVPPPASCYSPFFGRTGSRSASTWPLQGLVDVQNWPFHLVELLLDRAPAVYQVRDRGIFGGSFRYRVRNPLETKESSGAVRIQDRVFSLPRAPDVRIRENGRRPFVENPGGAPCAGRACTPPNPLCLTLADPEIGQHRRSEGVFFLGIGRYSAERRKKRPLRSESSFFARWATAAQAVYGGLKAAEPARGTHSHGTRPTGAAGSRPAM